jgi:hypothetical protein
MKYIINHNDLERFIDIYLSMPQYIVLDEGDDEFVLRRKESKDIVYDDYIYTYYDGRLLVESNIVWAIAGLFGISGEDALEYIGGWFENTYKLPVEEIIDWL